MHFAEDFNLKFLFSVVSILGTNAKAIDFCAKFKYPPDAQNPLTSPLIQTGSYAVISALLASTSNTTRVRFVPLGGLESAAICQ